MTRIAFSLALVLASAIPALAEPRLVRVIWDVGNEAIYYKEFPRAARGHDGFMVPRNVDAAIKADFILQTTTTADFLRKGDRVRIYVVNYNPISHVWHEASSVVEQVALEPSLVGPLLNALTLAITGLAKQPPSGMLEFSARQRQPDFRPIPECPIGEATKTLDAFRDVVLKLGDAAGKLVNDANNAGLAEDAKKLADVATHRFLWNQFNDQSAWKSIRNDPNVYGANFAEKFKAISDQVKPVRQSIDAANDALLALDRAIAAIPRISDSTCIEAAKWLITQRDNIVTYMREVADEGSPLRVTLARLQAAGNMWSLYTRKLEDPKWNEDAIELVVKEPIQANVVLRVDGVFVSPEKTVTERLQRSLVLGVRTHVPMLVISSGVGGHDFKFKKLEVVKTTTTTDGTTTLKNLLRTTDDTAWQRIVPVWIQSVRIWELPDAGVYGTFGTTPDRNIFKNAIAGGSVFVPRWRTVFTAGLMFARYHDEDDLKPVITQFSDASGFALPDVSATNVPLPRPPLHKSFYWSVTFGLATF